VLILGIATGIDKLLDLVQDKKRITIKRASKELKIPESKIETWGRILSDEDMLELNYPANPLEPPFLQIVGYSEKKHKKKKKKKKKEEKKKKKHRDKPSKRKMPSKAFLSRFKGTKKREFKTYKEKVEKAKTKKKSKLKGQVIMLIIVIVAIILMLELFGYLDIIPFIGGP
jgi:hypothetical protein